MYCIKCGVELPREARFCTTCGLAIDDPAVALEAVPKRNPDHSLSGNRKLQVVAGILAIILLGGSIYWYQVGRNIIGAPFYEAGDKWTYHYPAAPLPDDLSSMDDKLRSVILSISRGDEEGAYEVIAGSIAGEPKAKMLNETGVFKDSEWWGLWVNDDGTNATNQEKFRFPLHPGKSWATSGTKKLGNVGITTFTTEYQVGEWETVTVLAGTFRALPIRINRVEKTASLVNSVAWDSNTVTVVWYSPDVKNKIKENVKNSLYKTGRVLAELKSYSVK